MASDINCSHGKEPECPEILIDVDNVRPAQRLYNCCICRVPKKLREIKAEAYTPKLISIGPVHHNKTEVDSKKELENRESLKLRYFKEFFCQTPPKSQKEFANIIIKNEEKIRQCYAADISLPGKEDFAFVKMILLDSIFIIELFLRTDPRTCPKDNYIVSEPGLEDGIKYDLILLENQLPFFILNDLYCHIGLNKSFLCLAWNYFFPQDNFKNIPEGVEVKHFTDLQRYFYNSPNLNSDMIIANLYSATKLDLAGLNFKKWEKKSQEEDGRLLDIQIKKPNPMELFPCFNCSWLLHCLPRLKCFWCLKHKQTSLLIPPFVIYQETERIFRNIMALEQCYYPFQAYICNYFVLLDFLIKTREDVELLVDKEIIAHSLGSNQDVVEMVKELTKGIVEKNSCYYQTAKNLNKHYENWWNILWNKNIVSLKTVYFRDIWRGTATIAGIIVLLITIANFLMPFFMKK